MTHLTFIRYFVPDSNEFAPGWYQTRNEGRTRIGDVPLSLSDALYDGPNRVIIDDNTPETNTLPVSGGKGVDEFLITRTANSVVIDDDSEANVIVFERDVVITSIERQAGSEGASVAQYVITLSSGKTITLRNPASFTFQHLGDATRTAPISAEDFFTAYEDGFAASDASHPDIIGDASGPSGSDIVGTAYEGDPSTSGDLDVNSDVTLATTTPFTVSTQGDYGTASINDDGEWVYTLDNGNTDVRALNSGDTLTDTFVVDITATDGAQTQTITITISGRTDVLGTNGPDFISQERTSDNVAIFGFNSADTLTGGSGDDLLVGGYGADTIDLSAGGTDTVVYRINSSDTDGLIKAEDGGDTVMEFTPGEDKLVILDVNGSPTTLTDLFDSLTGGAFQLGISGDTDGDFVLSSSELDAGARAFIDIVFQANGTPDGDPASATAGLTFKINFDRVTSEALNDMTVWDTLTGGTDFSASTISTVALLSSLFGGFGRPGYDAALDDGGFISIIGPDDLSDSYFEIPPQTISGDETGSVTEGGAPGDDNTGRLTAPGHTITLVSKKTTDSPGMSTGTYGVMRFDGRIWTYTLDDRAEVLADQQTETESFTFSAGGGTYVVTITVTGVNDAPTVSGEFFTKVGAAGGQFILSNLSDRFTDVDQGDELTFTVTLDDGAALSTIGLTYDSDEDEITGTLTETGSYVIKIVATDKSGATVEATFDLNILPAISIIQRNSLTYNPDVTSITIDETMLEVISGNESDPTLLVYTITTLPDAGVLLKSGTPLNNGDTFTQADINNGLITYVPDVSDPSTSQSNPLSFTISDGEADLEEQTLEITSREVVGNTASAQDNTADFSDVDVPQKIEAGDGSDIITGGQKDDQIDGGAGDDEIILTRTINNVEEDAGADEVLYEFGYDGVGIDGGDEIVGFKRGQDKVTFVVQDSRQFTNLEEFLGSLKGADDEDLTADDAFIVTMQWGTDEAGAFYFDGVLLHFKDATSFGGGRVSSPLVTVTFDQQLDLNDLTEILGGAEKVADNFDFTHAAFKNLNEVLPRLFGESSVDFVVLPFSNSISVIDGPVTGAEVFFDIDDDGEVSDVEKDAQRDASGRSLYITGDDGSVSIPEEYVGLAFVADVDGAYDTATGERLEGAFRSLDKGRGGIATPITDLIVTYLEEVEGQAGTPTTEQEVLDEIFGDDEVTLADVLDAGNYEIPADTNTPENNKKDLISRAAIALTEIKENNDLTDGDGDGSTTKVEIVSALKTLVDLPDDSSVVDLKAAVDARVAEANAVKGGKPIATPTSVDGVEDTDYAFPDTPEALTGLFGFRDPEGNDPAADTSSFRGVYIRIAIENASLRLDDNTQVVADTDLSGSDTADAIAGYVYVTFDNLDSLKITPAPNFNGDLALVYRVWDGEEVSSDAELIINIAGVNDAPVVDTAIGPQRGTVDLPITAIILENLFSDVDDDELTLTVMGLPRGLSYARDTGITGTPDTVGTFTVTVVADDGNGGTVETTFDIVVGQIMNALTGTISLANPTPPNNLQGAYGALKFDAATKTWTYTPDAAARQALRAGEERTETFTFTDATDNSVTEDVTITVVGVNDAPVVDTAIGPQRVTVDLPITAIILENLFSDVDDDVLTLTVTRLPSGLSYARDTGITGTPDTVGTFTVTVVANDGNGGIVETTFDIVVAEGQVVNEDTVEPVSGTISLADPTDPGVLQGTYGTLKFDAATKTWTYTLDNTSAAVQALGAGEERTETFTFTDATDNSVTEDVEITVVGVNDAPEITAAGAVSVQDGDTSFASDILTIVDVDEGDIAKLTSGSFTLTAGTGATAAIVNKFEVVQDTNGRWQLQLKSGQSFVEAEATFIINVSVTDAGGLSDNVDVTFNVASARVLIDAGNSDIVGAAFEGDLSTSGDLDVNSDVTLASTTPFTISTQGTYGTASIGDDGEWVYTLDNGNADVRALNSGQTLTDTFVVDVTADDDSAQTQTITITISGKTDVLGTNGPDSSLGDASTGDNQAIFGFNSGDTLTGGSGDDLLVGGYGLDIIDLSAGGRDTVVYRINSSDGDGLVKAEDGGDTVMEFTPGEDKLVILDINGSPTTLTDLFDSLTGAFQLGISGDTDGDFVLSSTELDHGARAFMDIVFEANGTPDGYSASATAGLTFKINFDRVTSEALNDAVVWDALTGGTDFSASTISTAALLSSLFGGFGRPGYDAALDAGDFISIIGPDDLPDSYFEIA